MAEAPVTDRTGFAWSKPDFGSPERGETYRTFPLRTASILVASGGMLAVIGGLGTWLRAVELKSEGLAPQPAGTLWGYTEPSGKAIAIFAAVTVFIAAVVLIRDVLPRFALEGSALALFAALLARLVSLNARTGSIVDAARQDPNFLSYNAGFTWGAWLMLLAAVLVFLGLLVGALRQIDLMRGLTE
ncbi:MAG: hypothetical protein ABR600_07530 [Actinomycetota bacterium]